MKAEVEMHLRKRVAIDSVLPSNILIGPFFVSTDGVRQGVGKKHRALATAVLELLARKLRTQAEDVRDRQIFESIFLNIFCLFL